MEQNTPNLLHSLLVERDRFVFLAFKESHASHDS